jgi:glucose dehydrogenase
LPAAIYLGVIICFGAVWAVMIMGFLLLHLLPVLGGIFIAIFGIAYVVNWMRKASRSSSAQAEGPEG